MGCITKPSLVLFTVLLTSLHLTACTTVSRGSNTYFVVNTMPEGATVTTDKALPKANTKNVQTAEFYGCAATPCKIKMPRRSEFNMMITKQGYQPFFYVVQTKHYKETAKDEEIRTAVQLASNGKLLDTTSTSNNAGMISEKSGEAAVTVAGMATTGYLAGASVDAALAVSSAPLGLSAFASPVAVLFAEPIILSNMGVDLASGSLLDLTPNPMMVKLAPSIKSSEDEQQEEKFIQSRTNKLKN